MWPGLCLRLDKGVGWWAILSKAVLSGTTPVSNLEFSMNDDAEYTEAGIPVHRYEDRDRDFEAPDPDSESISAIENHIERYVGKPEHVFHELASDMVHIDLHIVPPSEDQDFYTIVTSGMSDRPMAAPEGAEEYRYAEMVIALPPDWRLNTEDFKDERHYWPLRWLKWLSA